jgi:gas vesicle protein
MEEGQNDHKSGAAVIIACGLVGLCVGAALGLLLAPQSGKDTREMLVAKARAIKFPGKKAD